MSDSPLITPDASSSDVLFVAPTGNAANDTANLQAAIDALSYTSATMRQGTVVLSGRYLINKTLTIGQYGNDAKRPVSLVGASQSDVFWAGPLTDGYLLTVDGQGRGRAPRLVNLHLWCNKKCRGVLMRRQAYTCCMRDCYVLTPRQIGVDLVQCWGSNIDNVHIVSARGICYRSTSGSMSVRDCRFNGLGVWYGDGASSAANDDLAKYEMANGQEATRAYYGANYSEDWPAADDSTVLDSGGNPVRTAETARAACVIGTGPQHWTNPIWESCSYGSRPLMWTKGPLLNIQNTRFEGNLAAVKWVLEGNGLTLGKCCRFENTHMADPAVWADCLLELRGTTYGTRVIGLLATYLRAVVRATSGTHTNVRVEDMATWSAAAPSYPATACANGATIVTV